MNHADGVDLKALSLEELLLKRKSLRRRLSARSPLLPIKVAVLGASTTNELVDLLEIWLLDSGFAPVFYQSEYGRYEVEAVHDPERLVAFAPEVVYLHTSYRSLQGFAPLQTTEEELAGHVKQELARWQQIWSSLGEWVGCQVIQNNFELPPRQVLGNLDATLPGGQTRFVMEMNREFARVAAGNPKLLIQDVCSISARVGVERWFDWERYFSYKLLTTPEGSNALATSLSAMIRGMYGRTRKVLVLDLDNTLWGGVIGDDGVEKIVIGKETPLAEAYTAFQEYCLSLRNRGVLLAVCSKNDEEIAKQGFEHPDSVLRLEHISCFKANWEPKHENIQAIARQLNLGVDSFVFVDDNPAERAIVEGQVDGIAVPNVGSDVTAYARILEAGRFFEQTSFSQEDMERAALYQENSQRAAFETKFADYGEYLDSLEMTAEIEPFNRLYIERIAQLTNKTNQFNLTTRRYTLAEMEAVLNDTQSLGLYGRLSDRFGDNGLISIVLGRLRGEELEIELWLMSCRVLKREMEDAMLDALVERADARGVTRIRGVYLPTKKNGMVAEHYPRLGFRTVLREVDGRAVYELETEGYVPRNMHIERVKAYEEELEMAQ